MLDNGLAHWHAFDKMPSGELPPAGQCPSRNRTISNELPVEAIAAHNSVSRLAQRKFADLLLLDNESPLRLAEVGELHREQGRLREATICLQKAVELMETLGFGTRDRMYAYLQLGQVLLEAGQEAEAGRRLRKASELAAGEEHLDLGTRSLICSALGQALAAQGDQDAAAPWLAEAEAHKQELIRLSEMAANRAKGDNRQSRGS